MLKIYESMDQGSDEWLQARCGLLTASEMCRIMSPPPAIETRVKKNGELYKQREWEPVADNDTCRAHLYELLAQRITGHVEPRFVTEDMLRGTEDEIEARILYAKHYAPVTECGFMTLDIGGFRIGYSPDGLVGDDGLLECKSRRMKFQTATILDNEMPDDYLLQCQTGLLVSGRKWLDFISYCGGMPMFVCRIYPDANIQKAILDAAMEFERKLSEKLDAYGVALRTRKLIPTERRVEQEIFA